MATAEAMVQQLYYKATKLHRKAPTPNWVEHLAMKMEHAVAAFLKV